MKMHTRCFNCGAGDLSPFYEVEGVPVHSVLLMPTREEAVQYPRGDLKLAFCPACGFVQNMVFDPEVHEYSTRYEETQGFSPTFNEFAKRLAQRWVDRYDLNDRTLLEIGCGKGEFLALMCEAGSNRGIAIDPSCVPERVEGPAAPRIRVIQELYSEAHLDLEADFICCRHTLEHIQPTKGDLYYEHCSYFSLGSLARLFRSLDFEILELETEFDDQYLILDARISSGPGGRRFEAEEDLERLAASVERFRRTIPAKLDEWRSLLRSAAGRGEKTVLWGSGSKAVAFLTTLGVGDEVGFVTDINPYRHHMFMPGTGHEIVPPADLKRYRPDNVVIMNPIYRDEIRSDLESMGLEPRLYSL
jgi:SAM-dependent methyltransferase